MSWIKLEHVTPDKPEIYQMADFLQIPKTHVLGCLVRFWAWADQHLEDGCDALRVTHAHLDEICACAHFADALRKCGWLAGTDGDLILPNFTRHNGETAKRRALTQKRSQRYRGKAHAQNVTLSASPEKRREEKNKDPPTPKGGDAHAQFAHFEVFWKAFPRKVDKLRAKKSWLKLSPSEELRATILSRLELWKKSEQWLKEDGQFIPHASTWLNGKRWEDELSNGVHKPERVFASIFREFP